MAVKKVQLVMVRHGESVWNKDNRFTGWKDVTLSATGLAEARSAGQKLIEQKFNFDFAYTSYLTRAIMTLNLLLEEMNLNWIPVEKSWRLNERHYGELQGLNKSETAAKFGEEQVKIWRRSFSNPPPMMKESDPDHPKLDQRYKKLAPSELPVGESLEMTVKRVLPYWDKQIVPKIKSTEKVLICAHGNSLRSLILTLEGLSPDQIMTVDVPTGIPLVYDLEFDDAKESNTGFVVTGKRYLATDAEVNSALHKVVSQGKSG